MRVRNHPFPALDGDCRDRVIVDGEEVNKGKGTFRRRIEMRHMDDAVKGDMQSFEFRNHAATLPHVGSEVHLKICARLWRRRVFSLFFPARIRILVG